MHFQLFQIDLNVKSFRVACPQTPCLCIWRSKKKGYKMDYDSITSPSDVLKFQARVDLRKISWLLPFNSSEHLLLAMVLPCVMLQIWCAQRVQSKGSHVHLPYCADWPGIQGFKSGLASQLIWSCLCVFLISRFDWKIWLQAFSFGPISPRNLTIKCCYCLKKN